MTNIESQSSNNSYAQALFELANESKSVETIEIQARAILQLIQKSSDFLNLIKDPTNKLGDQLNAINSISDNFKFHELLKKYLCFLIIKRRFYNLKKIFEDFLNIVSNSRGEMQALIIAAKDLKSEEVEKIKKELSKYFDKKIKLNYKHDPSLIGGLIIKVGSTMIDTSIKNKLKKIEKQMIEA